ncbi:FAD-binding oxidoreductase [Sporichthya sp.]|uniref:FAD-binding oxidoreductase n=1 Tax=Sporichthya sp. TaxID=65475 RepID=UPI0017B4F19B|nr:FAD-binding oxidoreductase [Sporichthya sp.]MBA3743096.1 FAD-binding oxidoreductase [Sporichthya sp.]
MILNDIHSRLNPSRPAALVEVTSTEQLRRAVTSGPEPVIVAGGRHAMGGQQFVTGGRVLDSRGMNRVLDFDADRGLVEVEAGIQWPELVEDLLDRQQGCYEQWTIAQKQTGANHFTVGGSISANAHGRGLGMAPIADDVESLRLVTADGSLLECSRITHSQLFSLVLGGYGLFGAIATVTLRLTRRQKLERVVSIATVPELVEAIETRTADGYRYGDFQFAIDPLSPDFLHRGVFSCYRPVELDRPIPENQRAFTAEDWQTMLLLAHVDKARAYEAYADHYLATSGQLYWSDLLQLAVYLDEYHEDLDARLPAGPRGTEMISEVYVPRHRLTDFMAAAAESLRRDGADPIYGTVRFIEQDRHTFLPWARQNYACIVLNLHTEHSPAGLERSAAAFRNLIDEAIVRDGSYYLTYHRWARPDQLAACYPQFGEFLAHKRRYDPTDRFVSDWFRHHVAAARQVAA